MKRFSFQYTLVFIFFLCAGLQKVSAQVTPEMKYFKAKKEFRESLQTSHTDAQATNQNQIVPEAVSATKAKAVDRLLNDKVSAESKVNEAPEPESKKEQIVDSHLEGKNISN